MGVGSIVHPQFQRGKPGESVLTVVTVKSSTHANFSGVKPSSGLGSCIFVAKLNELVVSSHLKNISQIGNLPLVGGENKKRVKPPPSEVVSCQAAVLNFDGALTFHDGTLAGHQSWWGLGGRISSWVDRINKKNL